MTTSYTYGKGIGYQSGDDGGPRELLHRLRRNMRRNDFDRTHTFVQSYVYELPFWQGQAVSSTTGIAARKLWAAGSSTAS